MSYAIIVTDSYTGNKLELCRVGANPEAIAAAARGKTYRLNDRKVRRYSKVEIVEVGDGQP